MLRRSHYTPEAHNLQNKEESWLIVMYAICCDSTSPHHIPGLSQKYQNVEKILDACLQVNKSEGSFPLTDEISIDLSQYVGWRQVNNTAYICIDPDFKNYFISLLIQAEILDPYYNAPPKEHNWITAGDVAQRIGSISPARLQEFLEGLLQKDLLDDMPAHEGARPSEIIGWRSMVGGGVSLCLNSMALPDIRYALIEAGSISDTPTIPNPLRPDKESLKRLIAPLPEAPEPTDDLTADCWTERGEIAEYLADQKRNSLDGQGIPPFPNPDSAASDNTSEITIDALLKELGINLNDLER